MIIFYCFNVLKKCKCPTISGPERAILPYLNGLLVQKDKSEGVCGQLKTKNCFQRQSFIKYLRLILSAIRETFNVCFLRIFC